MDRATSPAAAETAGRLARAGAAGAHVAGGGGGVIRGEAGRQVLGHAGREVAVGLHKTVVEPVHDLLGRLVLRVVPEQALHVADEAVAWRLVALVERQDRVAEPGQHRAGLRAGLGQAQGRFVQLLEGRRRGLGSGPRPVLVELLHVLDQGIRDVGQGPAGLGVGAARLRGGFRVKGGEHLLDLRRRVLAGRLRRDRRGLDVIGAAGDGPVPAAIADPHGVAFLSCR